MSVVPLRLRTPRDAPADSSGRPFDFTIDLQRAIDGLRSLSSDLEAYYWDRPADGPEESQRFQISHWIRQLSDRSAALESIVLHKGSARLQLCKVPVDEAQQLERALAALEQSVYEEDPFERILQIVAAALAAADRMGLRGAGGRSERAPS